MADPRTPTGDRADVIGDVRALARAVLLAFADLGIHLPSSRERIIDRVRCADHVDPDKLRDFIDLCIEAHLIAPAYAGGLALTPSEAQALAESLDGHTPVPESQATHWTEHLALPLSTPLRSRWAGL